MTNGPQRPCSGPVVFRLGPLILQHFSSCQKFSYNR